MVLAQHFEDNGLMSTGEACQLVGVSRSGYGAWREHKKERNSFEEELLWCPQVHC
ncbi:TPA: hypothetical protein HA361_01870 [Candidatus Woesearchaeota archaeon]|nr:hypothetical protein [Candidatus Woesearchaeota archaeon]HII68554.1 hypothetical protein [Candidatus Woesearchaeota archaeon]